MYKIEYEVALNDTGRPCVELSKDYEDKPEDKFFAIELARYILQGVFLRNGSELDVEASKELERGIQLLGQIGDEIAMILYENMKLMAETSYIFDNKYHVVVKTIEDRDNIGLTGILQDNKLYFRQEGFKVLVLEGEAKIYELKDGIENENWVEIDGSTNE